MICDAHVKRRITSNFVDTIAKQVSVNCKNPPQFTFRLRFSFQIMLTATSVDRPKHTQAYKNPFSFGYL